jgi:hypothetical protein
LTGEITGGSQIVKARGFSDILQAACYYIDDIPRIWGLAGFFFNVRPQFRTKNSALRWIKGIGHIFARPKTMVWDQTSVIGGPGADNLSAEGGSQVRKITRKPQNFKFDESLTASDF